VPSNWFRRDLIAAFFWRDTEVLVRRVPYIFRRMVRNHCPSFLCYLEIASRARPARVDFMGGEKSPPFSLVDCGGVLDCLRGGGELCVLRGLNRVRASLAGKLRIPASPQSIHKEGGDFSPPIKSTRCWTRPRSNFKIAQKRRAVIPHHPSKNMYGTRLTSTFSIAPKKRRRLDRRLNQLLGTLETQLQSSSNPE